MKIIPKNVYKGNTKPPQCFVVELKKVQSLNSILLK